MRQLLKATMAIAMTTAVPGPVAGAEEACKGFGPQTPRDIRRKDGRNPSAFPLAPAASALNLCNIHLHAPAENRGPGFSLAARRPAQPVGGGHGAAAGVGFRCGDATRLSKAELAPPATEACGGLQPGDTIEVHWVYSSCDVAPGKGLGACLSARCSNPALRVEAQVFLLVDDRDALDFARFDYAGQPRKGVHQAKALPRDTGEPVVFRGSTTGPDYTEQTCSPMQVTWSVRPSCAKLDIATLGRWCAANAFGESSAHGPRQLVTTPALLDRIR